MSELKTLKDFEREVSDSMLIDENTNEALYPKTIIVTEELKAEAVKWVKRLRQQDVKENDNQNQISIAHFIDFFNIKEEDLK